MAGRARVIPAVEAADQRPAVMRQRRAACRIEIDVSLRLLQERPLGRLATLVCPCKLSLDIQGLHARNVGPVDRVIGAYSHHQSIFDVADILHRLSTVPERLLGRIVGAIDTQTM